MAQATWIALKGKTINFQWHLAVPTFIVRIGQQYQN